MIQPFSPEHIKRYLLFYAAVIVLIVLFYLLNTRFNPTPVHERKIFDTERNITHSDPVQESVPEQHGTPFKLLPRQ